MSKSSEHTGMLKVFIADSSKLSCQLIAAELRRGPYRTRVVGFAINSVGIREGLDKVKPDVVVIGDRLENGALTGFDATREVRASHVKSSVIMILDSSEATMVVDAFRAGASGIFCRDQSSESLCKSIHAVHRGGVWASSEELNFLIDALSSTLPAKAIYLKAPGLLTKREEGVVRLVVEGFTNRDISHQLNLSEHTVRNYLFRIFNKVGTSNRVELALYAIERRQAILSRDPRPPLHDLKIRACTPLSSRGPIDTFRLAGPN
jgi:DNA-binding NarL/FixJ family response regulator